MIYLDANAVYSYYGREKLLFTRDPHIDESKLRSYLDACPNKSVPASVYMEMVVHFRDNPSTVKELVNFLIKKKFVFCNNLRNYYCMTREELICLQMTPNDDGYKQYAYRLLDKKIDIEARYAFLFIEIVSLLYVEYYLKVLQPNTGITDEELSNIVYNLGKSKISESKKINEDNNDYATLVSSLRAGYFGNDNAMSNLKKLYWELLAQNCNVFQTIIGASLKPWPNGTNIYEFIYNLADEAKHSGLDSDKIKDTIVSELKAYSTDIDDIAKTISAIFQGYNYTKLQAVYMKKMLIRLLVNGKVLEKNNIFDMLYLGSYSTDSSTATNYSRIQSSFLLTFDMKLAKSSGLTCGDSGNKQLIESFIVEIGRSGPLVH